MGQHHERKRANPQAPVTNIVTYVPKAGKEAELLALVKKHEPALRKVGLVTASTPDGNTVYADDAQRPDFPQWNVWSSKVRRG